MDVFVNFLPVERIIYHGRVGWIATVFKAFDKFNKMKTLNQLYFFNIALH